MNPQDLLILLKIFLWNDGKWSTASLGKTIGLSKSQVHYGIKRCIDVGLIGKKTLQPNPKLLLELIEHGIKFMFPPAWKENALGIPTSYSTDPLIELIINPGSQIIWETKSGLTKGVALKPIYQTVPESCLKDRQLYDYFSLIDAYRSGRAREKSLALTELKKRINARGVKFA